MKFHISDGGKGGVGKSTTAIALINFLSGLPENNRVLVIETDTQNPDVIRSVKKSQRNITGLSADLRNEDGWNDLLENIERHSNSFDHAVMSLPGADLSMAKYVALAEHVFQAMGVTLLHYFTINRQPDSLNLLGKSIKEGFGSIANKRAVVLNGISGERSKFERWDESKVKKEAKAVEIFLPELYWKTVDEFISSEKTYDEFAESATSPLLKSRIMHWVAAVNKEFAKIEV